MPLDPNIILAGAQRAPQPFSMNSIAQLMQMKQMQIQMREQEAVRNSLAQIYSDPKNLGPDGMPNAQAIQTLARVSPQMAQQMMMNRATIQEKQAMTSKDQLQAGMDAQKNIQSIVRDPALNAYDDALAKGKTPQQAQQIAQGVYSDGLQNLFTGGYVPDAMKNQVPMQFDPVRVRANSLSYKDRMALEQKQKTQQATQDYRAAELGMGQQRLGMENARLGMEQERTNLAAGRDAVGGASGLSDDAITAAAARYNVDGTLPPMGMGRAGMSLRTEILNRAAKLAAGQDPTAQREGQLTRKAAASARSALERTANNIQLAEKTALGSAEMVEKASANYKRSDSPLINRGINAYRSDVAGDPNYQKYANDIATFKNEYVKVMTGSGQATDAARNEADHMINPAMSHEQILAGISEMKKEMERVRESAIQSARESSTKQITPSSGKTLVYDPATGTFK